MWLVLFNLVTMIVEKWKPIKDYPDYEVSNLGKVRSSHKQFKTKKRLLKPWKTPNGYYMIQLCDGKRRRCTGLSRIVAEAYVKNYEPKKLTQINHKDGNKENNAFFNLEWCTPSQNIYHAHYMGLIDPRPGERCTLSRFRNGDIIKIRKMKDENPDMKYTEIGKMFNASGSTIRKIILRQRWKHI